MYHLNKILNLIVEVSLRNQSAAWLVLSGMVIFVLGAVLGWYGFPALIRSQIISVSINILSHFTVLYVKPYFAYSIAYGASIYINLTKESRIDLMCSMSVHYIIQKNFKHQRMHKEFFRQL
jgi:hypothetical protein